MVRRFVQDNQAGGKQKQLAKRHTGLLAAGKSGDGTAELFLCKSKALQHACHFALIGISVGRFKSMCQSCISIHQTL